MTIPFPESVSRDAAKAAGNDCCSGAPASAISLQASAPASPVARMKANRAAQARSLTRPRQKGYRGGGLLPEEGRLPGSLAALQGRYRRPTPPMSMPFLVWPKPSTCSRKMRMQRVITSSISISCPTGPRPNRRSRRSRRWDPAGSFLRFPHATKVVVPSKMQRTFYGFLS